MFIFIVPAAPGQESPLLDKNQAAAYLNIHPNSLKKIPISPVVFPGVKKILYKKEDLDEFIEQNKVQKPNIPYFHNEFFKTGEGPRNEIKTGGRKKIPKSLIQQWVREA